MVASDRGMRVFVAALNAGSLTGAARTLGLGQPAVSHAITRLEEEVGTRLLERSRTGVRATEAGRALFDKLQPAFAQIDEAIAETRSTQTPTVSMSVSTSLASWWLMSRLPDFKRANPDISLRLVTADADDNVDMSTLDLWIPLGRVERSDLEGIELCREALIPVASAEVAKTLRENSTPLENATLLHLEERYEARFDWKRWFAHHRIDVADPLPGDRSNDYSLVLQAALEGQGVALGWEHIVRDLIADGRLVPLADPVVTNQPFVVLSSNRRALSPSAAALRQWLINAMALAD